MVTDLQSFKSVLRPILPRLTSGLFVRVARVPSNTYSLSLQKSDENSKRNGFKTLQAREHPDLRLLSGSTRRESEREPEDARESSW